MRGRAAYGPLASTRATHAELAQQARRVWYTGPRRGARAPRREEPMRGVHCGALDPVEVERATGVPQVRLEALLRRAPA